MKRLRFLVYIFICAFSLAFTGAVNAAQFNCTIQKTGIGGNNRIAIGDRITITGVLQADTEGQQQDVDNSRMVCKIMSGKQVLQLFTTPEIAGRGAWNNHSFTHVYTFTAEPDINYTENIDIHCQLKGPVLTQDIIAQKYRCIDLCPPEGTAVVNPTDEGENNYINRNSKFTITVTDAKGQLSPNGGTSCILDLRQLRSNPEQMILERPTPTNATTYTSPEFFATQFPEQDKDILVLSYTLNDQINPGVTKQIQLKFDNKPPRPVENNTGFISADNIITDGEEIILRAQASAVGNGDSVRAKITFTGKKYSPGGGVIEETNQELMAFTPLAVDGNFAAGGNVNWRHKVDADFAGCVGRLRADFEFYDMAGNKSVTSKTINIDYRPFNALATVVDTNTDKQCQNINADSSFMLKIDFGDGSNYCPSDLTEVTADLSAIGLGVVALVPESPNSSVYVSNVFLAATCRPTEGTFTFKYRIKDPVVNERTGDFLPVSILIDTISPAPNPGEATGFKSEDAILTFDEAVTIVAQVARYGVGDYVKATVTFSGTKYSTDGAATAIPDGAVATFDKMRLIGGPAAGAVANWEENITNYNFNGCVGRLKAVFEFHDITGNITTTEKGIDIDYRPFRVAASILDADTNKQCTDINGNSRFYFKLDFGNSFNYQPSDQTQLVANLEDIGLGNVPLTNQAPGVYVTNEFFAGECGAIEDTFTLTYTVQDNVVGERTGNFLPVSIAVDTVTPNPALGAATGFESADEIITINENVVIIAQVPQYGPGDYIKAEVTFTGDKYDGNGIPTSLTNDTIATINKMTNVGPTNVGAVANWRDVINYTFTGYVGTLKVSFEFHDKTGNFTRSEDTIAIDYRPFNVTATVINAETDTQCAFVGVASSFYLKLDFGNPSNYQPSETTQIFADLTNIGLNEVSFVPDTPGVYISNNIFAGACGAVEGTFNLLYTIRDNVVVEKTGNFQPTSLLVDTVAPSPTIGGEGGTGFESDDGIITFGEEVAVIAQVNKCGPGDFVKATIKFTGDKHSANTLPTHVDNEEIKIIKSMKPVGALTVGSVANWRDVVSFAFTGYVGVLTVDFEFKDMAGNTATITRSVDIDYRPIDLLGTIIDADTGKPCSTINRKTRFQLQLDFSTMQNYCPSERTEVTADLSAIGVGKVPMAPKDGNERLYVSQVFPAAVCSAVENNFTFTYSIKDEVVIEKTGNFVPVSVYVDTINTSPARGNETGFESDDGIISEGENVILIAQTTRYRGGDFVKATLTFTGDKIKDNDHIESVTDEKIVTIDEMTADGNASDGGIAKWKDRINHNFTGYVGILKVTYDFCDLAGNFDQVVKEVEIDYRKVKFIADVIDAKALPEAKVGVINYNSSFYFKLDFGEAKINYFPREDAKVTVDLTAVGLGIVAMQRKEAERCYVTEVVAAKSCSHTEATLTFEYSIEDAVMKGKKGTFSPASIAFDNIIPDPDLDKTGYETDKKTLIYGDNIDLIATVRNYSTSDFASVTLELFTDEDHPVMIASFVPDMNKVSAEVGGNAVWKSKIDPALTDFIFESGNLRATFDFLDLAGNCKRVYKTIKVDFKLPEFNYASATVMLPSRDEIPVPDVESPYKNPLVATAGCFIEFAVQLKEMPASGVKVTVDLSPIGITPPLELTKKGENKDKSVDFAGYFKVPLPGEINGLKFDDRNQQFDFEVMAVDGNGQEKYRGTMPSIAIDNIVPIIKEITISNTTLDKKTTDPLIVGDSFDINVRAAEIESGSLTVDLSKICLASFSEPLSPVIDEPGMYRYSGVVTSYHESEAVFDGNATFTVSAFDTIRQGAVSYYTYHPGQYTKLSSPAHKVDNQQPMVTKTAYTVKDSDGYFKDTTDPNTWVIAGDKLILTLDVASTTKGVFDGQRAFLDNAYYYGFTLDQFLVQEDKYVLELLVPPTKRDLKSNGYVATMSYHVVDDDGNLSVDKAFKSTDESPIFVKNFDSFPPDLDFITFKTSTQMQNEGVIQKGDIVFFEVKVYPQITDVDEITVGISTLSGGKVESLPLVYNTAEGVYKASYQAQEGSQAEAHRFEARIKDIAGNVSVKQDNVIYNIDCVAPEFEKYYFKIGVDNGDNPSQNVANIKDRLWLCADISNYYDGWASATLYFGDIDPDNFIATAPFKYDSDKKMHIAEFVVKEPGKDRWKAMSGDKTASLTYVLTAIDGHKNVATVKVGRSTQNDPEFKDYNFTVRNIQSTIHGYELSLEPNNPELASNGVLIYNIGDKLKAVGYLANEDQVSEAWLDLSVFGRFAPKKYLLPLIPVLPGEVATGAETTDAIDLMEEFSVVTDQRTCPIRFCAEDMGGFVASKTLDLIIDTKRPEITSAEFDGCLLTINMSEDVKDITSIASGWILRSDMDSTPADLSVEDGIVIKQAGGKQVIFELTHKIRAVLADWNKKCKISVDVPAKGFYDVCGNANAAVEKVPVEIVDDGWRKEAFITSIKLDQIFGASYTDDSLIMTINFSRAMDFSPLVDKAPSKSTPHTQIAFYADRTAASRLQYTPDFKYFYVFQEDDEFTAPGSTESLGRTLQVKIGKNGTYWFARILENPMSQLKASHRYNDEKMRFVTDEFGKPMKLQNDAANPLFVMDNRSSIMASARVVSISGPTEGKPMLDLSAKTLTFEFTEPVRLFRDDFTNDRTAPYKFSLPTTRNKPVNEYRNKIKLYYNLDLPESLTLQFNPIPGENGLYGRKVVMSLSDDDMVNILGLYKSNEEKPNWGVRLEPGTFQTIWNVNTLQYSDYIDPIPGEAGSDGDIGYDKLNIVAAAAASSHSPMREDPEHLKFEIELEPNIVEGMDVPVPFDQTKLPRLTLCRKESGSTFVLADTSFNGWSKRKLNGKDRDILTFSADIPFSGAPFDSSEGVLQLSNIFNILKHDYGTMSIDKAYFINDRNSSAAGYANASETIVFDNKPPEVVAFSHLDTGIGICPAFKGKYELTFSEPLDTSYYVTFKVATGSSKLAFKLETVSEDKRILTFTNTSAITDRVPNGTWYYSISGARDRAGNIMPTKNGSVEIKTDIPEISKVTLYAKRAKVDPDVLTLDKPFNFDVCVDQKVEFGIQYAKEPENVPHFLRVYGKKGMLAEVPVSGGKIATASLAMSDMSSVEEVMQIRVSDYAGNETESIKTILYDTQAPEATSIKLQGVATYTAGIYSSQTRDMTLTAVLPVEYDEPIGLAVSYHDISVATQTYVMNRSGAGVYKATVGGYLAQDGEYTLSLFDMAGNIHTGAESIILHIDNTTPIVESIDIIPSASVIGKIEAGAAKFAVKFSEPMDPRIVPEVYLATGSVDVITMRLKDWSSDYTLAEYVNSNAVNESIIPGKYFYHVRGGFDISANPLTELKECATATLEIQSRGPVADLKIIFAQRDFIGTEPQIDMPVNANEISAANPLNILLTYVGGIVNGPHKLEMMDRNGNIVGTYSPQAMTSEQFGVRITDGSIFSEGEEYCFRLTDRYNNVGAVITNVLTIDNTAPIINEVIVNNGEDPYKDGVYYCNTTKASENIINIILEARDSLRIAAEGVAVDGADIPRFITDVSTKKTRHVIKWPSADVADGEYTLTFADAAGNITMEGADVMQVILHMDSTAPKAKAAYVCDSEGSNLGVTKLGNSPAASIYFAVEFDEVMSPEAYAHPIAKLAIPTTNTYVDLEFVKWVTGEKKAIFRNKYALNDNLAPGVYEFNISEGYDMAGNKMAPVTGDAPIPNSGIEILSQRPRFTAVFRSKQTDISDEVLINQPFSPAVAPNVATISITYDTGHPMGEPHEFKLYDNSDCTGEPIYYELLSPDPISKVASVTVNEAFFGYADNKNGAKYYFNITDSLGGVSDRSNIALVLDNVVPEIANFTLSSNYYNPDTGHGLSINSARADEGSDPLRLAFVGEDGKIVPDSVRPFNIGNDNVKSEWLKRLTDGKYTFKVFDGAGNEAVMPVLPELVIDRAAPRILSCVSLPDPIKSGEPGDAEITVEFNEPIDGEPTLELATSTRSVTVNCTFSEFTESADLDDPSYRRIAVFKVGRVINSIPQGKYNCIISAKDFTGNKLMSGAGKGITVNILSQGPDIADIRFYSHQKTTSAGLSDLLLNAPYSFSDGGNLCAEVEFRDVPGTSASDYWLRICDDMGNVSVATLTWAPDNKVATYVWVGGSSEAPSGWVNPSAPKSYKVTVADNNGESLKSVRWYVDNNEPVCQKDVISFSLNPYQNDTENSRIYYNPAVQGNVEISFNATDHSNLKMRLTSPTNGTDTYLLTKGAGAANVSFDGTTNRSISDSRTMLPDGEYSIALADAAGNMAVSPKTIPGVSDQNHLYTMVIDTVAPTVNAYSMFLEVSGVYNSVADNSYFSPGAGNLVVKVDIPQDAADPQTEASYIEVVRSVTNYVYRRLPITDMTGQGDPSKWGAVWDGKDDYGKTVPANSYFIRAIDRSGNKSINTTKINVVSNDFRVVSAEQISPNSGSLVVNFPVNPTASNPVIKYRREGTSQWKMAATVQLDPNDSSSTVFNFKVTPNFESGAYTLVLEGVKSIYGSNLLESSCVMTADGDGPVLIGADFSGIRYDDVYSVTLKFNEAIDPNSVVIDSFKLLCDGTQRSIKSVTYKNETTVHLRAANVFEDGKTYVIKAPGITDSWGNRGGDDSEASFTGRDITPPELKISVFSNPMNVRDLVVFITSNEALADNPTLIVTQPGVSPRSVRTKAHPSNSMAYMSAVNISKNSNRFGKLKAVATDTAGIGGESASVDFYIGSPKANFVSSVRSEDGTVKLSFAEDSFRANSSIRVLQHEIALDSRGTIDLKNNTARVNASIRSSIKDGNENELASDTEMFELIPMSPAYEVSVLTKDIKNGFDVAIKPSIATSSEGTGLFYQNGSEWNFVTSYKGGDGYSARIKSGQMLALIKDTKAPIITLDNSDNIGPKTFGCARPEFTGKIEDKGSGVSHSSLMAVIDEGLPQRFTVDDDGNFSFKPQMPLKGGNHSIIFKAGDRTGNKSVSAAIRFSVEALQVKQVVPWPNPARGSHMNIRFTTNRADIDEDDVRIRIYDTAGHKVVTLYTAPRSSGNVHDFRWDLCNGEGKRVANGVYFAKVEIRDPDNPGNKFKTTLKLAVLR